MTNCRGGKITHVMADGTRLDDISGYLASHPEVTLPPVVERIVGDILRGKYREENT